MKASTKAVLVLCCAVVVVLEAPRAFSALVAGWRGPYGTKLERQPPLDPTRIEAKAVRLEIPEPRPAGRLELARR